MTINDCRILLKGEYVFSGKSKLTYKLDKSLLSASALNHHSSGNPEYCHVSNVIDGNFGSELDSYCGIVETTIWVQIDLVTTFAIKKVKLMTENIVNHRLFLVRLTFLSEATVVAIDYPT